MFGRSVATACLHSHGCAREWLALALVGVVVAGCGDVPQSPLTTDEACELLVAHGLQEEFGAWATRYQFTVWCNRDDQRDITITITPANNQPSATDVPLMDRRARSRVEALLQKKKWKERYTRVTIQVSP
jgi:hypothetical protein